MESATLPAHLDSKSPTPLRPSYSDTELERRVSHDPGAPRFVRRVSFIDDNDTVVDNQGAVLRAGSDTNGSTGDEREQVHKNGKYKKHKTRHDPGNKSHQKRKEQSSRNNDRVKHHKARAPAVPVQVSPGVTISGPYVSTSQPQPATQPDDVNSDEQPFKVNIAIPSEEKYDPPPLGRHYVPESHTNGPARVDVGSEAGPVKDVPVNPVTTSSSSSSSTASPADTPEGSPINTTRGATVIRISTPESSPDPSVGKRSPILAKSNIVSVDINPGDEDDVKPLQVQFHSDSEDSVRPYVAVVSLPPLETDVAPQVEPPHTEEQVALESPKTVISEPTETPCGLSVPVEGVTVLSSETDIPEAIRPEPVRTVDITVPVTGVTTEASDSDVIYANEPKSIRHSREDSVDVDPPTYSNLPGDLVNTEDEGNITYANLPVTSSPKPDDQPVYTNIPTPVVPSRDTKPRHSAASSMSDSQSTLTRHPPTLVVESTPGPSTSKEDPAVSSVDSRPSSDTMSATLPIRQPNNGTRKAIPVSSAPVEIECEIEMNSDAPPVAKKKKEGGCSSRRSLCELCLMYLVAAILLVIITCAIILGFKLSHRHSPAAVNYYYSYNTTKEEGSGSGQTSRQWLNMVKLRGAQDLSVAPCSDFYGYTCGNWMLEHRDYRRYGRWSVRDEIMQQNAQILRESLEAEPTSDPVHSNLLEYYKSCQNADQDGIAPLRNFLSSIGEWPLLSPPRNIRGWTKLTQNHGAFKANLSTSLAAASVYSHGVVTDVLMQVIKNGSLTIKVRPALRFLASDVFVPEQGVETQRESYKTLIRDTARVLGATHDIEQEIEEIVDVDIQLAKVSHAQESTEEKMTVKELFRDYPLENSRSEGHDWLQIIRRVAELHDIPDSIENDTLVTIVDSHIIKRYLQVFSSREDRFLCNYAVWATIRGMFDVLGGQIRQVYRKYEQVSLGVTSDLPAWYRCVVHVADRFPASTSNLYWKHKAVQNLKQQTDSLIPYLAAGIANTKGSINIDNINKEFLSSLMRSVLEEMPEEQVLNTAMFSSSRSFVFNFRSYKQAMWWPKTKNALTFMFSVHDSSYMWHSFGTTGTMFARLAISGLSSVHQDVRAALLNKNSLQQYSQRFDRYIISNFGANATLNKVVGPQGDIYMSWALRAAAEGYRLWTNAHGEDPRISALYTNPQLYYIAYSQNLCGVYATRMLIHTVYAQSHYPLDYTVNGALSADQAFRDVFSCQPVDAMSTMFTGVS